MLQAILGASAPSLPRTRRRLDGLLDRARAFAASLPDLPQPRPEARGWMPAFLRREHVSAGLMGVATLIGSALMFWPLIGAAEQGRPVPEAAAVALVQQAVASPPAPVVAPAVPAVVRREPKARAAPPWVVEQLSRAFAPKPLLVAAGLTYPLTLAPDGAEPDLHLAEETSSPASSQTEDFTGIWAVNERACTPNVGRDGFLPTVINQQGAWAGETTCAFKTGQREGNTWVFPAICSDASKRWKSDVQLTVKGKRLTWKSQSGSRSYVRCEQRPPRERIALSPLH